MKALATVLFVCAAGVSFATDWTAVGPAGVVLRALAADPATPGVLYVGTNSAGI